MTRRHWNDLSYRERAGILALASAELAFTAAAAADLATRPARLIRGPKPLWWVAIFVQPIGAPAYLLWGRGRPASAR
jgi:Phospholipase_D-nuclease N-terminal